MAARTLLAIFGGYAFCWGLIALCAALTFPLDAELHDGETLGSILALLIYPAVFLWAFAARSLWRVGAVTVGGGALMAVVASLIQMRLT
ncbi:iron uptake protein [Paracidovorax wautersii]|uniref:iron uptake protein n=1 Tax=Paracidovorax wautersii TaxID=1177982 RepID=UPI001FEBBAC1|nr:iron uptake protein [Paracidovorax wautersii]